MVYHDKTHGIACTSPNLLATHADCTMQEPEDSAVKEALAHAEDLLQQSQEGVEPPRLEPDTDVQTAMADYVGPRESSRFLVISSQQLCVINHASIHG